MDTNTNQTKTSAQNIWNQVEVHLRDSKYRRERHELMSFPQLLEGVSSFADVGASLGPYVWMAHYHLENTDLHVVEANHHLCDHIRGEWRKVESSGKTRGNSLNIINGAVSDTPGVLTFEIDPANFLNSCASNIATARTMERASEKVEVNAIVLDELFPDKPPGLFKIDVEGSEWRAVNGAKKILRKGKSKFLVEIHPWGDPDIRKRPSDVFRIFREHGYGVRRYNQHWLFEPASGGIANSMRSACYGMILDRPWMKKTAKRILRFLKK